MSYFKKTVCVDLDGVLAQYDGWKGDDIIGDAIPGAHDFVRRLMEFSIVSVFTTRISVTLRPVPAGFSPRPTLEIPNLELHPSDQWALELGSRIYDWLAKHDFPEGVAVWLGHGKPIAAAYVDDRAVVCRPQDGDLMTGKMSEASKMETLEHVSAFEAALQRCRYLCSI